MLLMQSSSKFLQNDALDEYNVNVRKPKPPKKKSLKVIIEMLKNS